MDEIKKEKLRVVQNIQILIEFQNKLWSFRKLLKKDESTHKAAKKYYRIIWRLYDENNKIILNWFCCAKCDIVIYCNLSKSGSKILQNHKCYKKLLLDEKNQSKETNDGSSEKDTTDEIDDSVLNFQVPQNLLSDIDDQENDTDEEADSSKSVRDDENETDESNDEAPLGEVEVEDDDDDDEESNHDDSNDDEDKGQNPSYYSNIFHELSGLLGALKPFSHKEFKEICPKTYNPTELYVKNNNL